VFGDNQQGNRKEEGWTPFSIQRKTVEAAAVIDPNGAREVSPMMTVSRHDRALIQRVGTQPEDEAEATADVDPKASSVIVNASDSENDSSENGTLQIQEQSPIHPSSLPLEPETPVVAEKVPSLLLVPLAPLTSPGSSQPAVAE